jgi:hypothetical protein
MMDEEIVKVSANQPGVQTGNVLAAQSHLEKSQKIPVKVSGPKSVLGRHLLRPVPRLSRPDPAKSVKADLARLTAAWKTYQSTRVRDAVYLLLDEAYQIGLRWKRERRAKQNCRFALSQQQEPIRMQPEPFAVLLFCAGVVDSRERSKFSRVLRVAEAHEAGSVERFCKKRDGINQVAGMFWEIET